MSYNKKFVQEHEREEDKQFFDHLSRDIHWFFFSLFIIGYVEDAETGLSFRLPGGMKWSVYVEVSLQLISYKFNRDTINYNRYVDSK